MVVGPRLGETAYTASVQVKVKEGPEVEPSSRGKEVAGQIKGDTVQEGGKKLTKPDIRLG